MEAGAIIQITDEEHHWFPALLTVTEDKGWGVMAYAIIPNNDPMETNGQAYIRIKKEQFELVGQAIFAAP